MKRNVMTSGNRNTLPPQNNLQCTKNKDKKKINAKISNGFPFLSVTAVVPTTKP